MKKIQDKPGGVRQKNGRTSRKKVVSTKLTELQYYAIRKRAGEAGLRISEYVRQAVVSAEVIPRPEQAGCRTPSASWQGKPTTSISWRTGRMPEVSHWLRWNF